MKYVLDINRSLRVASKTALVVRTAEHGGGAAWCRGAEACGGEAA